MVIIKIGVSGLSDGGLMTKAGVIEMGMTGNPNFPTPNPPLSDLTNAKNAFAVAITAAAKGGTELTADKNAKRLVLMDVIRNLSYYVQETSGGDEQIILSSGFEVRKTPEPIGHLPEPQNLSAKVAGIPGMIDLNWRAIYGAGSYVIEINSGDPNDPNGWSIVTSVKKSKATISGLTTGTVYWFRVYGVGAAGNGDMSDPAKSVAP